MVMIDIWLKLTYRKFGLSGEVGVLYQFARFGYMDGTRSPRYGFLPEPCVLFFRLLRGFYPGKIVPRVKICGKTLLQFASYLLHPQFGHLFVTCRRGVRAVPHPVRELFGPAVVCEFVE